MCGIVGIANGRNVVDGLVSGLKNLEYRGYDSVGIATLGPSGLDRRRAQGKIASLESLLKWQPLAGPIGIGHTRWATHGAPNEVNAHPHIHDGIAVVHNGIIENFKALRAGLVEDGVEFTSETDSEVVPALVARYMRVGMTAAGAVRAAARHLEGQFALAVLVDTLPGLVIATRHESPLVLGRNEKESLVASDMLAFAGRAEEEMHLQNGDVAIMSRSRIEVFDNSEAPAIRPVRDCRSLAVQVGKAGHRHYMHKEIYEQKVVVPRALSTHGVLDGKVRQTLPQSVANAERLTLVACGTSYYAGMISREWFETLAGIPVDLEVASEFRYSTRPVNKDAAALFISQSGETADTLSCLRMVKEAGQPAVAVVNVPTSSMAREADAVIESLAGPEIGVASTKAFTAQLAALMTVAMEIGYRKGTLSDEDVDGISASMDALSDRMEQVLAAEKSIKRASRKIVNAKSAVFIGRGANHALAMEGALKLKETSYIHAEGFAAGELKHGPIALIDEEVPAFVIAPKDRHFQKTLSNAQEIAARSGQLFVLSDKEGCQQLQDQAVATIEMPDADSYQAPFIYAIALQLVAYHTATLKGTDVDQPRNLAKSVTVE